MKYLYLSNGVHDKFSCLYHDYNDLFSTKITQVEVDYKDEKKSHNQSASNVQLLKFTTLVEGSNLMAPIRMDILIYFIQVLVDHSLCRSHAT